MERIRPATRPCAWRGSTEEGWWTSWRAPWYDPRGSCRAAGHGAFPHQSWKLAGACSTAAGRPSGHGIPSRRARAALVAPDAGDRLLSRSIHRDPFPDRPRVAEQSSRRSHLGLRSGGVGVARSGCVEAPSRTDARRTSPAAPAGEQGQRASWAAGSLQLGCSRPGQCSIRAPGRGAVGQVEVTDHGVVEKDLTPVAWMQRRHPSFPAEAEVFAAGWRAARPGRRGLRRAGHGRLRHAGWRPCRSRRGVQSQRNIVGLATQEADPRVAQHALGGRRRRSDRARPRALAPRISRRPLRTTAARASVVRTFDGRTGALELERGFTGVGAGAGRAGGAGAGRGDGSVRPRRVGATRPRRR